VDLEAGIVTKNGQELHGLEQRWAILRSVLQLPEQPFATEDSSRCGVYHGTSGGFGDLPRLKNSP
jgi:hypothetical protein